MEHTSPDKLLNISQKASVKYCKRVFLFLRLTPNQITWTNFLINNLAAVVCYAIGTYVSNMVGLVFCIVSAVFDHMDGAVARERNMGSELGKWLDPQLDALWQVMLVSGIFYGKYQNPGFITQNVLLPFGLLTLFFLTSANAMGMEYAKTFGFDPYSGPTLFRKTIAKKRDIGKWDALLLNAVFPVSPTYTPFFTIRYFIIIGTLFHVLDLAIIVLALTKAIQLCLMFFVFYQYKEAGTDSKILAVQLLKTMESGR